MDQKGIELLIIEVVDVYTVCGMGSFPIYFDVVLGEYLALGLRHLIAGPFKPIRPRTPICMEWVPGCDIDIG